MPSPLQIPWIHQGWIQAINNFKGKNNDMCAFSLLYFDQKLGICVKLCILLLV